MHSPAPGEPHGVILTRCDPHGVILPGGEEHDTTHGRNGSALAHIFLFFFRLRPPPPSPSRRPRKNFRVDCLVFRISERERDSIWYSARITCRSRFIDATASLTRNRGARKSVTLSATSPSRVNPRTDRVYSHVRKMLALDQHRGMLTFIL